MTDLSALFGAACSVDEREAWQLARRLVDHHGLGATVYARWLLGCMREAENRPGEVTWLLALSAIEFLPKTSGVAGNWL